MVDRAEYLRLPGHVPVWTNIEIEINTKVRRTARKREAKRERERERERERIDFLPKSGTSSLAKIRERSTT